MLTWASEPSSIENGRTDPRAPSEIPISMTHTVGCLSHKRQLHPILMRSKPLHIDAIGMLTWAFEPSRTKTELKGKNYKKNHPLIRKFICISLDGIALREPWQAANSKINQERCSSTRLSPSRTNVEDSPPLSICYPQEKVLHVSQAVPPPPPWSTRSTT